MRTSFFSRYRNAVVVLCVTVFYLDFLYITNTLSWVHLCFVVVIALLFQAHQQTRYFLLLVLPFVIQHASFDLLRFVPFSYLQPINVVGPYTWEVALFGASNGSEMVPLSMILSKYNTLLMEYVASVLYTISDFMIPLMALFFWKRVSSTLSERFMVAFLVMNLFAFVTYVYFPVAAPWYVQQHGLFEPSAPVLGNAAGLADMDSILGISWFTDSYQLNPVVFGAIPSMHAGFSAIIALYCINTRRRGLVVAFGIYLLAMCISAVYLNHHYIIDLILGILYAMVAYVVTERFLARPTRTFYSFFYRLFFTRTMRTVLPLGYEDVPTREAEGMVS